MPTRGVYQGLPMMNSMVKVLFHFLSNDALIRAQQTLRRNKELSLLITIGLYALNIIDANVDSHLLQYNVDKNLAVNPFIDFDTPDISAQLGLSINFNF